MASRPCSAGFISPDRVMGVFDYGRAAYRCWANIILGHSQRVEASPKTTNYFLAMNISSLKSTDAIP